MSNFWRATQADPDGVVAHADWPVSEVDLHARHRWLVLGEGSREFRDRMRSDPEYYDVRRAGWWVWGICCWIGGGWCKVPEGADEAPEPPDGKAPRQTADVAMLAPDAPKSKVRIAGHNKGSRGKGVHAGGLHEKRPRAHREHGGGHGGSLPGVHGQPGGDSRPAVDHSHGNMDGVHSLTFGGEPPGSTCNEQRRPIIAAPHSEHGLGINGRPQLADAYDIGRGVHGNGKAGTCAERRAWLLGWFGALRDRLRNVRVCCGDWKRVVLSESVTTRLGVTGVFLDPPYALNLERMHAWIHHLRDGGDAPGKRRAAKNRAADLYASDGADVDRMVAEVQLWCLERGSDPMMRIVLAGYQGEHDALEAAGWQAIQWQAQGGYGNRTVKGRKNAGRERLWVSPHCQRERTLFDAA